MAPANTPKATGVEIVATQPTDADRTTIAHLSARDRKSLPPVAYIVKIGLEKLPPATGSLWWLYLGDHRVAKYRDYKGGIFFKVFDPQFFQDHQGQAIRFSADGKDFVETGLKLTAPPAAPAAAAPSRLPRQEDVLK
jgi:hypothetical protein